MRCLNHPDLAAEGSCMLCKNLFCEHCLEDVGDRRLCLDCLESMAESSFAIEEKSFLGSSLFAAGGILALMGLAVGGKLAISLAGLAQVVFISKSGGPIAGELVSPTIEGLKAAAYLVSGYGVLMSRHWAYWFGIAVSLGTIAFLAIKFLAGPSRLDVLLFAGSAVAFLLIAMGWKAPKN
jgi:hypothetical protein